MVDDPPDLMYLPPVVVVALSLSLPSYRKEFPVKNVLVTAMALVATAGAANAQVPAVEFRFVERQGQTQVSVPFGATPTTDGVLNFAIQARVTGGTATDFLGNFSFDIIANGEADANGTLTKLLTSDAAGTYNANSNQSNNATVGRGGLAVIYTYLAGINPNFNGLINTTGGTFTNTAGSQEIGLVTGSPTGNALLLLTDTMGTGNPDTYSGSGVTAPIDPTVASTYLGAAGNFVDVYRFKYTLSSTASRVINFSLANLTAQVGSSLQLSNGVWGPAQANAAASSTGISIPVAPAPASAALLGLGGLVAARRRRVTA